MKDRWRAIEWQDNGKYVVPKFICSSENREDCEHAVEARINETDGKCNCEIYFM